MVSKAPSSRLTCMIETSPSVLVSVRNASSAASGCGLVRSAMYATMSLSIQSPCRAAMAGRYRGIATTSSVPFPPMGSESTMYERVGGRGVLRPPRRHVLRRSRRRRRARPAVSGASRLHRRPAPPDDVPRAVLGWSRPTIRPSAATRGCGCATSASRSVRPQRDRWLLHMTTAVEVTTADLPDGDANSPPSCSTTSVRPPSTCATTPACRSPRRRSGTWQ